MRRDGSRSRHSSTRARRDASPKRTRRRRGKIRATRCDASRNESLRADASRESKPRAGAVLVRSTPRASVRARGVSRAAPRARNVRDRTRIKGASRRRVDSRGGEVAGSRRARWAIRARTGHVVSESSEKGASAEPRRSRRLTTTRRENGRERRISISFTPSSFFLTVREVSPALTRRGDSRSVRHRDAFAERR